MEEQLRPLAKTPKGQLRLDAKAAYKNGQAMLTVYGYSAFTTTTRPSDARIVLLRIFVPRDTPKAEKYATLRTLCDTIAFRYDCDYKLRSKLPINEEKQNEL
jgi:hypothetical protein